MTAEHTTPSSDAEKQASALPLRDEVIQWRGMKATKAGGSRIVLIDVIVVGDEMEKALIEETARRRRAEILLQAMNSNYIREHEETVAPSEKTSISPPTDEEIATCRDLYRAEIHKRMDTNHPSASPSTESMTITLHKFVEMRNARTVR